MDEIDASAQTDPLSQPASDAPDWASHDLGPGRMTSHSFFLDSHAKHMQLNPDDEGYG